MTMIDLVPHIPLLIAAAFAVAVAGWLAGRWLDRDIRKEWDRG